MKLLADANIEAALVRWLRSQHHDVVWANELPPATSDTALLSIANEQGRVLMTYDRDFGELVFLRGMATKGIILLRFAAPRQSERLDLLQQHWTAIESQAPYGIAVVSERKVRFRSLP